jgi:hypothetical protein
VPTTTASLKRKREIDEDVGLYGEEETTAKKNCASKTDDLGQNNNMEFAMRAGEVETKTEVVEWLLFLVSQEGGLQVISSF